jgi:hypothetical protein
MEAMVKNLLQVVGAEPEAGICARWNANFQVHHQGWVSGTYRWVSVVASLGKFDHALSETSLMNYLLTIELLIRPQILSADLKFAALWLRTKSSYKHPSQFSSNILSRIIPPPAVGDGFHPLDTALQF